MARLLIHTRAAASSHICGGDAGVPRLQHTSLMCEVEQAVPLRIRNPSPPFGRRGRGASLYQCSAAGGAHPGRRSPAQCRTKPRCPSLLCRPRRVTSPGKVASHRRARRFGRATARGGHCELTPPGARGRREISTCGPVVSSVGRFFACALSAATRRRSAQPQLAPTAVRKAGARRRKASAQELQTTHRSGTSNAGRSQQGGPVSDYKGQGARGSTPARGGYDATWSLIERAHGEGKGTHTGVLLLRQGRGRAPGPPGKVGTRPGCRVLPAAGRSRRTGARRELTRSRSGDRQARVVMALTPG